MNIAIFFDLPAGGALRTMEEVQNILGNRHKITVFHDPEIFPFFRGCRFIKDIESVCFQSYKQRKLAKKIDNLKFDLCFVSHDRHSQAPWILRFLETPTIFLCQEPTRAYFEEFLSIDRKLPILNKIYESINRKIRKQIEIHNARFADRIVSNSRYSVESIFRAYGINSTPIHLGIDPKEYYFTKVDKMNQVVVVGNNEPQKDLLLAVTSVALIEKKNRPNLIIASPRNSDMRDVIRLAKKRQVKIKVITRLDQADLRKVYNQSKITLALAHLEPFGLSVIESLACGTPVVAVNEGGFRETIIDGKTGYLVERDPQKVANRIEELLKDKEKQVEMGKMGIKDVNKRFTWDNTVEKLEEVFYETKDIRHHR